MSEQNLSPQQARLLAQIGSRKVLGPFSAEHCLQQDCRSIVTPLAFILLSRTWIAP